MTNTNQQEQLYSRQDVINAWNSAYGGDRYLSREQYVDDLLPTPPVEDGKQGGEVKTDKIKLKLEYKVIHIDGSDEYGKRQSYSKEAELLNDMGNEGWELVSVTASSINYNVYYYFKQSKT